MRRITLWLVSTIAALILLFSYRTSTMGLAGAASVDGRAATDQPASTGGPAAPETPGNPEATGAGRYEGLVVQTRLGPIQVVITVADGKITDVSVPTYPNGDRRHEEINDYALPILRQSTLRAQRADVDTVSGATVTSDGYRESLQAAIDAAHLT